MRLLRRVLPRTGALGRTLELLSRGSAFSFWIRPEHCTRVPWGVGSKGAPHGAGSQPLLEGLRKQCCWAPAGQATQLAGSTRTSTTPSSTCSVRKSSETSRYGPCYSFWTAAGFKAAWAKGDEIQSGQVDRVIVRTRFYKPYGHRQDPSQDRRSFQAGRTGTVRRTDVAADEATPCGGKGAGS